MVVAACSWLYLFTVLGLWALLAAADLWWPATLFLFSPRWLLALPPVLLLPAAAALRRRALLPVLGGLLLVLGPVMGFSIPWRRSCCRPSPRQNTSASLTCNMHYRPLPLRSRWISFPRRRPARPHPASGMAPGRGEVQEPCRRRVAQLPGAGTLPRQHLSVAAGQASGQQLHGRPGLDHALRAGNAGGSGHRVQPAHLASPAARTGQGSSTSLRASAGRP